MRTPKFAILSAFLLATSLYAQDYAARLKPIIESKGKTSDTERLHQLFEADWKYGLEQSPEAATATGTPGYNDRWSDLSAAAIEQRKRDLDEPLKVLQTIDRSQLSPADQLNFDLFERNVRDAIEGRRFPSELMPINQMEGLQQDIARMIEVMPFTAAKDYKDAIARINAAPLLIDQTIALMKRGLAEKITPPKITLRDVPLQIRNQIFTDATQSPVYSHFTNFPANIPPFVRKALQAEGAAAIEEKLMPAFRKLESFFTKEYLPNARESIAAADLPNGKDWYAYRIRHITTTKLSAREIHQIGLAEVQRIRSEMERVMRSTGFTGTFTEFAQFLRTDPRFFYDTTEDLLRGYRDIAKRVDPELAKIFGKLPRLPYGVIPIPSFAEKSQTAAYYQPGAPSAGRPGYFCANTYDLKSRPKWEMEALTLHEAVPGHHLQIALAQEMENVPEFRKHDETTVFVEGWALYSESLGPEMGFYKDPYAKFGQLTYEMWRAIRLVVDTGMHELGWTREQAIQFFKENSAKAEHDIIVEIDRYIVWPGQALAYKLGELKIKELRRFAQDELGEQFNLREFHDQVLCQGALPLDILEKRVRHWVEEKAQQSSRSTN